MYLFFDTETTGLPKKWNAPINDLNNWPRLVQLAFLFYDDRGNKLSEGNYIIKPDNFLIPKSASNIHGITNEIAEQKGIALQNVLSNFNKIIAQTEILIAHNMKYDEKIIGAELLRSNTNTDFFNKKKICTMEMTVDFCKLEGQYGYKWPKLSELYYKLFNTSFDEAHNAQMDIRATAKCFWELRRIGKI